MRLFCHGLTAIEGWGHTVEEISSEMRNPFSQFFIAEEDTPVGTVASFRYGKAAWIGLLIVLKEYRGRGVGTALMREALRALDDYGVETVRLEAVKKAVPLYERLGFTPEVDSLRLWADVHGSESTDILKGKVLERDMLKEICAFDEKYFGAERGKFLESYFSLSSICVVERNSHVRGYLMARKNAINRVGPCVCEDEKVFESLLGRALSLVEGTVSVGIPAFNTEGVSILKQRGFIVRGASLRMVRGRRTWMPENVFAIGAPEKG